MSPKETVLITGANGEIGHGLIHRLCEQGARRIVALDLLPLDDSLRGACHEFVRGDITDPQLISHLEADHNFSTIFHLASILSTRAERDPEAAHRVNVDGTLNLLRLATQHAQRAGRPVKFLYPSSIAVYGLPDARVKHSAGAVREEDWCFPITMYGCNKLYCEHLGRYYATSYRLLDAERQAHRIDFRCLRFPGLISAETVPTGGTSDYGPEMLHHAAQDLPYACFVRRDSRLPFMVMPDAIKALLLLEAAPRAGLSRMVYNLTSFNPSAGEIYDQVRAAFPGAEVRFAPDVSRQAIVDSWPEDTDDSLARRDWDWRPDYDLRKAFEEYLIPSISRRYKERA
jgi:nucleoside-diphosphate-sugar epimerase